MHQKFCRIESVTRDLVCEEFTAGGDILATGFFFEPAVDLRTRICCTDNGYPVARRTLYDLGGRLDLNNVAVLEFVGQRNDTAVDLCAVHMIADAGVDSICKIDWARTLGELYYFVFRCVYENLVRSDIHLERFHKLAGVRELVLRIDDLPHLVDLRIEPVSLEFVRITGLLIVPVRSDTELCDLVHRKRSDLHFKRRARMTNNSRVNGLVLVLLRHRDIVLETPWYVLVHLVYDAQYLIAFNDFVNDYPAREKVVDLIYRLTLLVHLLVDAVEVLRAAFNVVMVDAVFFELRADLGDNVFHEVLSLGAVAVNELYKLIVIVGMKVS